MALEKEVTVEDPNGIHARPASMFVQSAVKYSSDVKVVKDGEEYDGKSIMSILSLGLEYKSVIILKIEGSDEQEAMDALAPMLRGNG